MKNNEIVKMEQRVPVRGCSDIEWMAQQGAHQYADWKCTECGDSMCWGCGVRCTNNSTGEGTIKCPHCGANGGNY